jgi:hypothetical protein
MVTNHRIRKTSRRRERPCLEALEDRITPTIFTPTTFLDDGSANSLRSVITQANNDFGIGSPIDTIQLAAGTYTLTIANSSGKHERANAQGDLDIGSHIHGLVIQGTTDAQGHPTTTIRQTALDRVFQVLTAGIPVTFKDLIIEGGKAQDDGSDQAAAASTTAEGGGILDDGGNVILTNVVLQNNSADASAPFAAKGGGIYAEVGGSLTVQSSLIQTEGAFGGTAGNEGGSAEGGGIFSRCKTTITDSTLSSNVVIGGNAENNSDFGSGGLAFGGGIYALGETTITDSILSGNTLTGGSSSSFFGGSAGGGGVFAGGNTTITASTLSDNTLIGGNSNYSSVVDDEAVDVGGDAEGGGVYSSGTTAITASTLSGNTLTGGKGSINNSKSIVGFNLGGHAQGGGVFAESTMTITASTLSGNTLTGGDGNFVSGTVKGGIGGDASGGGVYARFATTTLTDSTLSGNTLTGGKGSGGSATPGTTQGGGASFAGGTGHEIINSTIADNQVIGAQSASVASSASGGGLFFGSTTTATLTNVTVAGNQANQPPTGVGSTSGGGIDNAGGKVTLVNTLVALNSASTGPDYAGVAGTGSSHNLIGDATDSAGFSVATHGDLLGTTANPLDPLLGPLANNGGPTPTRALLPGSPAFNAGDNSVQSVGLFDQRGQGFMRGANGSIDIGAFEVQPPLPPSSPPSSPPPAAPKPPPALNTPPLLSLFDALLHGVERVNGNGTETVTDSIFGFPLFVSIYDGSGDLTSVVLFGIDITSLFK